LGDVVTNLLLAYVASWIFFFVNDHWEASESKRNQAPQVYTRLSQLMEAQWMLLAQMVYLKGRAGFAETALKDLDHSHWKVMMIRAFCLEPDHYNISVWNNIVSAWHSYAASITPSTDVIIGQYGTFDGQLNLHLDRLRSSVPYLNFRSSAALHDTIRDSIAAKWQGEQEEPVTIVHVAGIMETAFGHMLDLLEYLKSDTEMSSNLGQNIGRIEGMFEQVLPSEIVFTNEVPRRIIKSTPNEITHRQAIRKKQASQMKKRRKRRSRQNRDRRRKGR